MSVTIDNIPTTGHKPLIATASVSGRKKNAKKKISRQDRQKNEHDELSSLEKRLSVPLVSSTLFSEMPLSVATQEGLKKCSFTHTSEIQRKSLPFTLCGRDVLGAAKTGSGKTLAFVIPILEILYRKRWTSMDGLGAIILSPTRELAIQIFEVLRKVGGQHILSAGLVIGGKDVKEEQGRIARMNILVATPGRLLQHLDQTAGFDVSRVELLVLDEADRILDMGFEKTLTAILEHLPRQRQTLLFSATQTKSVRDLARLSLVDPEYIAVHETAEHATPTQLQQNFLVCPLEDKLDILYSFIKSHLSQKAIVFLSTCKQVRYYYESFCRLRPGIPIMQLHGKQKQPQRLSIFYDFCKKKAAVLFCTDIAARGLDFPSVDWVLQLDCPEDPETYIHRVGRTARYDKGGRALLCLLPSEEPIVELLRQKKIPIIKKNINQQKTVSIQKHLEQFCARDPEMKYLAQKAFITYIRSIYFQKNKQVFDVNALPLQAYATALGLPGAPKIRFVKSSSKNGKGDMLTIDGMSDDDNDDLCNHSEDKMEKVSFQGTHIKFENKDDNDENESVSIQQQPAPRRIDKMFLKKNQNVLSEHYAKLIEREGEQQIDTGLFQLKRQDHELKDTDEILHTTQKLSHRDRLKMMKKYKMKHGGLANKMTFNEEGDAVPAWKVDKASDYLKKVNVIEAREAYISMEKDKLRHEDVGDRELEKEKRREKKRALKLREKEIRREHSGGGDGGVVLDNSFNAQMDEAETFDDDEKVVKRKRPERSIAEEEALALSFLKS